MLFVHVEQKEQITESNEYIPTWMFIFLIDLHKTFRE
jgi:hypothetical protein